MKRTDERLAEIRIGEAVHRLRPGQSVRIGRHASNDIVLDDRVVSRFHAQLLWPREQRRPSVVDLDSQDGVGHDATRVRRDAMLADGSQLRIGPFELQVKLEGCGDTPAQLDTRGDDGEVVLATDGRPGFSGRLSGVGSGRELLLDLQRESRTGTLSVTLPDCRVQLTFCAGRVVVPEDSDLQTLQALVGILDSQTRTFYRFERALEVVEANTRHTRRPSDLLTLPPVA